ncbi:hypothetical protein [uncultured Roseibium sp.]|uniref:hypothetical protein n=1 Tax=uncultured Roseibium sp. TaxID=1936171 RepID=UPI0026088E4E|nr:hypothetical protein [uncultured Roseibium sp.]
MTMVQTKARVWNLTRNQLLQGVARRFFEIAADHGKDCDWYLERIDVMLRMELIEFYYLVVFKADEPIAGAKLCFDWGRHTALVESMGEFFDPEKINQFGTTDSIADTMEAVRAYVDGLFEHCGATRVEVWYSVRDEQIKTLGSERVDQLLDVSRSDEAKKKSSERWAKIMKAKADKGAKRVSTLGDLPEASFDIW